MVAMPRSVSGPMSRPTPPVMPGYARASVVQTGRVTPGSSGGITVCISSFNATARRGVTNQTTVAPVAV
jgi:hypothetical protein